MFRPSILVQAARHAARAYRRDAHCPAFARAEGQVEIISKLEPVEEALEEARRTRVPGYSPARHVHILGALLAERARGAEFDRKPIRTARTFLSREAAPMARLEDLADQWSRTP